MKKLKSVFFLLVLVQGFFYLLLIPPWQSPDEPWHFGYGLLLSRDKDITTEDYKNLNKKIIESMAVFHAWKYQNLPRPRPLPDKLSDVVYFGSAGGIIGAVSWRAPLYYLLSSLIIKWSRIDEIFKQLFFNRILSLIFFLFTVYFTYLSSRIVFKDKFLYCLATTSFVAFLPQLLIISTSVNPINLSIALETFLIFIILYSLKKNRILPTVFIAPLVIGLAFFNHRSAIFTIPPLLVFLLIYFINSLRNKRERLRTLLLLLITISLFIALYLFAHSLAPDSLNKVVRESGIRPRISELTHFFQYLSSASGKSHGSFLDGFFKSFWYFSGWMRFGYLLDPYSVLKLISLLALIGLFKYSFLTISKKNYQTYLDFPSFLILITACLTISLGTIIKDLPKQSVAQGRYVFPAISAFAILFVIGLREIIPKKLEKWVPVLIIISFISLDIYTLFNPLIRVFYLFTNA